MLSGMGTRLLLVGTGRYAPGSGLESVAAVSSTLADLGQALRERCGVAPEHLRVLRDPEGPTQLGLALAEAAEQASEVLLVYYVGHGVISPGGQLYLSTAASDRRPTRLAHTALAYSAVREAVLASKARSIIVVLDCCFSGRAVETLGTGEIADLAAVHGGYVLAAASRNEMALAPAGQPHTAFTGELIRLLTDGDPQAPVQITLRHVFDALERAALARNFPLPQQRASGTITDLVLCTNPAYQPPHQQPTPLPDAGSRGDLCPYPGLAAFGPASAQWFFGRENLCAELLRQLGRRMDQPGPVVVVGPSGSGKSSLLRAGLVPALAQGVLPVPGSRSWPRLVLTPTVDPLGALATTLAEASGTCPPPPQDLADAPRWFTAAAQGLVRERARGAEVGRARLVVVVDQLEELFTVCAQEPARHAFLTALCAAASGDAEGEPPALVVFGMRADFYSRLLTYPALRPALQDAQLIVGPMNPTELAAAITTPAELVGLTLQPGLVELLLRDLGVTDDAENTTGSYEAGALPLLAHALRATWEQRSDHTLTVAGYQATGGIHGAVATTAEGVYRDLDEVDRDTLRRILLRLVHVGDGTEDTRRRLLRTELIQGLADPESAAKVLDALTAARLIIVDAPARRVTVDDDPTPGEQDTVEIIHEALLRAWPRLRAWIDTDRAGLLIRQRLAEDARAWAEDQRDPAALYRGGRLAAVRVWADDHHGELAPLQREFLLASTTQQDRERRSRRRRVQVLAAALVLAVIAFASAAGLYVHQRTQTRLAQANELAARSATLATTNPDASMLLALEAFHHQPTPQTRSALLSAQSQYYAGQFTGHTGTVWGVAFSPDGRTLATTSGDDTARLWDVATRASIATLTGHTGSVRGVAFSPDGRILATVSDDQTARLWDVASHRQLATLTGHTGTVEGVAFSPDGRILATVSDDQTARLWDVATRAAIAILTGHTGSVRGVAFSPDGRALATTSTDETARLWDVASHQRLATLTGHTGTVEGVAFSPDGRILATVSDDQTARLWDVATRQQLATLTGHTSHLRGVAFSPDGRALATTSTDETARLWDVASHQRLATLTGHTGPVYGVTFSPDGRSLATTSLDQTARLWNMDDRILTPRPVTPVEGMAFSPDGRTLATTSDDGTARLWDVASHHQLAILTGHTSRVRKVAFSPDGRILATASDDDTARLWDVASHQQTAILTGHTGPVWGVAFSPDGRILATASFDQTARLWDAASHQQIAILTGHTEYVRRVAFSPDGRSLATVSDDQTARLWDVATHASIATLTGHTGSVGGVAFSPDGRILATASFDQTARLWDVVSHQQITILTGHTGPLWGVAFSPNGRALVTTSDDHTVRLWDVATRASIATLTGHTGTVNEVAFSPDGRTLVTASDDGTVRTWDPDPGRVTDRLCRIVGAVSPADWARLIPTLPYRSPCP